MASLSTCHLELVVWDGNLVKAINQYILGIDEASISTNDIEKDPYTTYIYIYIYISKFVLATKSTVRTYVLY